MLSTIKEIKGVYHDSLDQETARSIFEELKKCTIFEIIKHRFYFISSKSDEKPKEVDAVHFVTLNVDENKLDLSTIARSLKTINLALSSPELTSKLVVCWASGSEMRRRNIAVCVGVFAMVYLNKDCTELGKMLGQHSSISVGDPLTAINRAINRGFINFQDFNEDVYDDLADVRLHWIVPHKILGFYGPLISNDKHYLHPKQYLKYFQQVGVNAIVRVRHCKFDANPFVGAGLAHDDLNITESEPSNRDLACFLECCEMTEGVVVVHCRELIDCVGCLAAAYLIKHHAMGADIAINWLRVSTPAHFNESRKAWIKKKEKSLKQAGATYRADRNENKRETLRLVREYGICSLVCVALVFMALPQTLGVVFKLLKRLLRKS